jgi:3-oxoacyl-[acyl-carrier-protein] synthase II
MERRVVVTGIGLVTPVGIGRDESWNALKIGRAHV